MTLACFAMGLTFEEALTAATINAAWSLDRAHEVGSLEPGKLADAVIVRGDATDLLHVRAARSAIAGVLKRGALRGREMDDRMTLTHKTVKALLEDFRSPAPTPGGGSAAALAGAVGASLLAMVAGLPKPRARRPTPISRRFATPASAARRSRSSSKRWWTATARRTSWWSAPTGCRRAPTTRRRSRARRIQDALKAAIAAPLDVMRACGAATRARTRAAGARQPERVERRAGGAGAARAPGCAARG